MDDLEIGEPPGWPATPARPSADERRNVPAEIPDIGFSNRDEERRARENFRSLSAREVTVLAYLSFGFSAKQVALTLNVSSRTVDTFRTRALLKLRARNTADAVRILAALSAREWLAGT